MFANIPLLNLSNITTLHLQRPFTFRIISHATLFLFNPNLKENPRPDE